MRDLRHALRLFAKSPAFTSIAVLSLALGIGANTAIFGLVHAVLIEMLPVAQPEQLVKIGTFSPKVRVVFGSFTPGMNGDSFSAPVYEALRDNTPALAGIAARSRSQASIRIGDSAERALTEVVSGNYFSLLGVRAAVGRLLTPQDDVAGAPPMCAVSYGYWQRVLRLRPQRDRTRGADQQPAVHDRRRGCARIPRLRPRPAAGCLRAAGDESVVCARLLQQREQ